MSPPVQSADMLVSSHQTTTDFIKFNNNNDEDVNHCEKPALTTEELALLAKLEEANRYV